MNRFTDTIPVLPRRMGPQEITPQEADNIIRGSWPARRAHDYAIHTAECADDDDDTLPGAPMAALMLVGLLTLGAACVAALVLVVLRIAP